MIFYMWAKPNPLKKGLKVTSKPNWMIQKPGF